MGMPDERHTIRRPPYWDRLGSRTRLTDSFSMTQNPCPHRTFGEGTREPYASIRRFESSRLSSTSTLVPCQHPDDGAPPKVGASPAIDRGVSFLLGNVSAGTQLPVVQGRGNTPTDGRLEMQKKQRAVT